MGTVIVASVSAASVAATAITISAVVAFGFCTHVYVGKQGGERDAELDYHSFCTARWLHCKGHSVLVNRVADNAVLRMLRIVWIGKRIAKIMACGSWLSGILRTIRFEPANMFGKPQNPGFALGGIRSADTGACSCRICYLARCLAYPKRPLRSLLSAFHYMLKAVLGNAIIIYIRR